MVSPLVGLDYLTSVSPALVTLLFILIHSSYIHHGSQGCYRLRTYTID